jgi:SAM-dependent methyltransferase
MVLLVWKCSASELKVRWLIGMNFTKTLYEYWQNRKNRMLLEGKISWLSHDKIERQSILCSMIDAKKYVKGNVLDVGCGNKPYEPIFHNIVDDYIGLDFNRGFWARKNDVCGSSLVLPFRHNSFDTLISTQVLNEVPEPKEMLSQIYYVLNEGGHLILTVPMTWGLHNDPYDYYRFTTYGLRYLAESTGFKVVYIRARTGFWGMIGQRLSCYFMNVNGPPRNAVDTILRSCFCATIQLFYSFLDNVQRNERETLGYVLVAKK